MPTRRLPLQSPTQGTAGVKVGLAAAVGLTVATGEAVVGRDVGVAVGGTNTISSGPPCESSRVVE